MQTVGSADLYFFKPIQYIELSDTEAAHSVQFDHSAQSHGIQPAATAWPAGRCTELIAPPGQAFTRLVKQLGGERAAANAGHVGLGDPQHVINRIGANTGAGTNATDSGIGGCDIGIGTMVDIKQAALSAFEHDSPALFPELVEPSAHIGHVFPEVISQFQRFFEHGCGLQWIHAKAVLQYEIMVIENVFDFLRQSFGVQQVRSAQSSPGYLILIGRADSSAGGANGTCPFGFLPGPVQHFVVRHDDGAGR